MQLQDGVDSTQRNLVSCATGFKSSASLHSLAAAAVGQADLSPDQVLEHSCLCLHQNVF